MDLHSVLIVTYKLNQRAHCLTYCPRFKLELKASMPLNGALKRFNKFTTNNKCKLSHVIRMIRPNIFIVHVKYYQISKTCVYTPSCLHHTEQLIRNTCIPIFIFPFYRQRNAGINYQTLRLPEDTRQVATTVTLPTI